MADPGPAEAARRAGPLGRLLDLWRNPVYRFALLFGVYLGGAGLLYPLVRRRYYFVVSFLETSTAWVEYQVLRVFSSDVALNGKIVRFGSFPAKIVEECTGAYEMMIFAAAVFAFPTTWRKRAIGLAMGIPLLYVFNVVRIAVLMAVGRYEPELLDFMHLYFWQGTLILMVLSVWLFWLFKVVREEEGPGLRA